MMRLVLLFAALSAFVLPCVAQTIAPVPSENESTVTVTLSPAITAPSEVKLYSNAKALEGSLCSAATTDLVTLKVGIPATAPAGSTMIVLVTDSPLAEGTPLCAVLPRAGPGGSDLATKVVLVQAAASPPGFDWGLVRAYFTAGALTSQDRDQFSHQDLFLAFRLDKVYWMSAAAKDGTFRPRLNTFFEMRLTALPVAVQSCNAASSAPTSASSSGSCSSSTNASSLNSSTSPSNPATTTQTYLNSQKSARLQFGVFYPVYLPGWAVASHKNGASVDTHYALYIAPMVKTGYDTALNGLNQTQQQSTTPSHVQPIGNSSQFYKFYDFGFRVGHDRLSTDKAMAPEQISYLDVGWGRFSNLASLLCPANQYQGNNTCSVPSGSLPWRRDVRLRVEGMLQVPATKGFSVGFSTNVSFYHNGPATGSAPVHIRPSDDLRFLFAYKFDISKIAAKLAPQNF